MAVSWRKQNLGKKLRKYRHGGDIFNVECSGEALPRR